jgi:hypothetical protein
VDVPDAYRGGAPARKSRVAGERVGSARTASRSMRAMGGLRDDEMRRAQVFREVRQHLYVYAEETRVSYLARQRQISALQVSRAPVDSQGELTGLLAHARGSG